MKAWEQSKSNAIELGTSYREETLYVQAHIKKAMGGHSNKLPSRRQSSLRRNQPCWHLGFGFQDSMPVIRKLPVV